VGYFLTASPTTNIPSPQKQRPLFIETSAVKMGCTTYRLSKCFAGIVCSGTAIVQANCFAFFAACIF
jgi:hypothetical protein